MNETLIIATTLTAAVLGFVIYKKRKPLETTNAIAVSRRIDNSSLEEDFRDILEFIPLDEVKIIIENYASHDNQIADAVSFINDQKRFIMRELQQIPEVMRFINFLRQNGLDVDQWSAKIQSLWKSIPRLVRPNEAIAVGGLSMMINKILKILPRDALHEHLRQKAKYSGSFNKFLMFFNSQEFKDLSIALQKSDILQQHMFWAKESGIEVTFAVELLKNLHGYMVELT